MKQLFSIMAIVLSLAWGSSLAAKNIQEKTSYSPITATEAALSEAVFEAQPVPSLIYNNLVPSTFAPQTCKEVQCDPPSAQAELINNKYNTITTCLSNEATFTCVTEGSAGGLASRAETALNI